MKRINLILLLSGLLLGAAACSSDTEGGVVTLDIASAIGEAKADDGSLFDLKMVLNPAVTDSTMISSIRGLSAVVGDEFYVASKRMMVFDGDGECLFSFDRKGNGPGEYGKYASLKVDPATGIWYAFCGSDQRVFRYTRSGEFLGVDTLAPSVSFANPFGGKRWISMNSGLRRPEITFYYLDDNLRIVDSLETSLRHKVFEISGGVTSYSPSISVNGREAMTVWTDTIWDISSPRNGFLPLAALDLGGHSVPVDFNPSAEWERMKEFISPNVVFTGRHYMVYFSYDERFYLQFFDRKSGALVASLRSGDGDDSNIRFKYGDGDILLRPLSYAAGDTFYFVAPDDIMARLTGAEDSNPAFFSLTIRR
ncbi:MAG: 6-bladed beta-propeller [Clostridium sp.]|nr:6-bladed beta-propeller [Clostridium sp.]